MSWSTTMHHCEQLNHLRSTKTLYIKNVHCLLDGTYVIFSLCYRWNRFLLWRRRKRWRAVRGFESRFFWRRLFLAGSRGWYRLGPCVRARRGCGWGRRGLELGWCWRSYFRELNRHLLVSLAGFGHVEGSFRCGMRKGLWCKTVTCQKCIVIRNTFISRDLIRGFRPSLFCSRVEGRKSSIYQTDCGQRVLHWNYILSEKQLGTQKWSVLVEVYAFSTL